MSQATSSPNSQTLQIATWRLWLLKAGYLLLTVGMGMQVIPIFFNHQPTTLDEGVVNSMLLAMVVLCAFGLRYPLKMLPILFWEIIWKTAWLLTVALPAINKGDLEENTASYAFACSLVIIIYAVVPWDYTVRNYLMWFRVKK